MRVREATQKGSKTARVVSSNTSSTLVPIDEEESSSVNEMPTDENEMPNFNPSPKGSSSEKLSTPKDEDPLNIDLQSVSPENARGQDYPNQEVIDLHSEISYLRAKVDHLTAKD